MYKIFTTPTFRDGFAKLENNVSTRIKKKLKHLAKNPKLAKKLSYAPDYLKGLCKYRIGEWRVLFWVEEKEKKVVLYAVAHRDKIYKKLE